MSRPKTYTSRPPASAKMARLAWDYFTARYVVGRRTIRELFYSPNCDGARSWCIELERQDDDTGHWKSGGNELMRDAPVSLIKSWDGRGRPHFARA